MAEADSFGDVERTFVTDSGERVSKVRTSRGGELFYSEESGSISQQEYSSKASQRPEVKAMDDGKITESEIGGLSNRYQAESTMPIGDMPPGSVERESAKQKNMFVGFLLSDDTPNDRAKAIQEYEEMQQRLRDAGTPEKEEEIKEQYNIGGT